MNKDVEKVMKVLKETVASTKRMAPSEYEYKAFTTSVYGLDDIATAIDKIYESQSAAMEEAYIKTFKKQGTRIKK